jgi:Leucine-rich repeat (LRR) protein
MVHTECQIPEDPDIIVVNLTFCSLTDLNSSLFGSTAPKRENLEKIDLSSNSLRTIENATFIHADQLATLNLTNNEIDFLAESAFEGLAQLENLYLNDNLLTTVDWIVFEPCQHLSTLEIDNNYLVILTSHQNTILNLQELSVHWNDLTDISGIDYLPRLQKLWLSQNHKLTMDVNTFAKNPKLNFLDIGHMGLEKNNLEFLANIPRINRIYLDSNNLTGLKIELLPKLSRLTFLSLYDCELDTLDYEVLKEKFPILKTIIIANNSFGDRHLQRMQNFLENNNIETSVDLPVEILELECVRSVTGWLILVLLAIFATIGVYFVARVVYGNMTNYNFSPLDTTAVGLIEL